MNCGFRPWIGVACLASVLAGCDYSSHDRASIPSGALYTGPSPLSSMPAARSNENPMAPAGVPLASDEQERKKAILDNVINLVRTAALQPGGDNFLLASENLNQYFEHTDSSRFAMDPAARAFLRLEIPEPRVAELEAREFTRHDARHIEDCMMYRLIATRVAGTGGDLTRVRRVFDWIVRQIQLVPKGTLGSAELGQVPARPYDVLCRGMATDAEDRGFWSERGWLFMALCRQLGIDVGLVTYTPPGTQEPVVWLCAALIHRKLYLFDPRIGLEVPGPDGEGVATLEEAMSDPVVLDRLDLPGQSPYGTTRDALVNSPSKIGILLDSSPGYLSPRMLLLQNELSGRDSTVLYRDPADQRDQFLEALGPRSGGVMLWPLPWEVFARLFHDPQFVEATRRTLVLFDPQLPLLYARIKQLRGELPEAIEEYMAFSFVEGAMLMDGKTPMPPEAQHALDIYATYFLALCHLDQNHPGLAESFFTKTLRLLPEYGPGQHYYTMLRWGAHANLARLHEARNEPGRAIAYYVQRDLTTQHHGNLVRARALVWRDPMAPPAGPLPPPPKISSREDR